MDVVTFKNRDGANLVTAYGTLSQWPKAGFPYASGSAYQRDLVGALTPLLPAIAGGAEV